MTFPSTIILLLAASVLPHGSCRRQHLDISSAYLQQLHDTAAKQVNGHKRHDDDRNLQIQNPCAYVKLGELESTYRSATGVEFDCSCQALGFSNYGKTVCESKEPFCCNFDENTVDMECQTAKETATFSVVPFAGYWVPRPVTTTVCMRFTGDDDRNYSEVCKTNEFTRDEVFDGSFTCEAKFDGSLCGDCTQCDGSDGSASGAYDCSNVARSSNFQVSCEDRSDSQRTCRAQSGAKIIATKPPTSPPSKSPTSPAPTRGPTPVPVQKDIPSTMTPAKENSSASKPTQSTQSDENDDEENTNDNAESELLKKIKGPQSLLCTNGSCILSKEEAAQQCNFYSLSKHGDANFNSNGKAVVESINTSEGPIDIGEGCVMKCKGCYVVLSPDDASSASTGFTTKLWSIIAGSMVASLAIVLF